MNFLHQVKSSIYDPDFYSALASKPVGKSLKYYFELASVIALLTTITFSVFVLPKIESFIDSFGSTIVSSFPAELEVKVREGKVSINVEEPYIVPVPKDFEVEAKKPEYENMLVINTKESFDLEKFENYKTFAFINEGSFVYKNDSGRVTIQSLNSVPNLTINRTTVSDWVSKTQPFVRALPFMLPVLAFLAILIAYAFNLIYIAIVSIFVWLLMKLRKIETSYKKSFQIALHAVTLPTLLFFVFSMSGIGGFAFLPTLLLLVVVWINFKTPPTQTVAL